MNNEKVRNIYIPRNYKTGANILGFEIKVWNVLQGIVLAAVPLFIGFYLIPKNYGFSLTSPWLTTPTIMFASLFGYLGLVGIHDFTFGEYVAIVLKFKKNQRQTFYNPRAKREAITVIKEEETREELPREKIIAFYNTYKAKIDEKNREAAHKYEMENELDEENMYFEDDLGAVDKPVEYMTNKEYREYKKALKKKARQEAKQLKASQKAKKKSKKLVKEETTNEAN